MSSDSSSSSTKDLGNLLANQPVPTAEPTTTNTAPVVAAPQPTTTTTTTEVASLREDMIKPAVSFLSSPNVKSAEKSKKIAFLQKKGLNQAEIDEAFKRAGDTASTTTNTTTTVPTTTTTTSTTTTAAPIAAPTQYVNNSLAPVLPARQVQPQIIYYPQPPPPPVPAEKVFALAVILGMGTVGVTAAIVGVLRRFIAPIFNRIAEYQRTRYNQRKELAGKLLKSLKSYQDENDDLDAVIDQGEEKTVIDAVVKHQQDVSTKLTKLMDQARSRLTTKISTYDDFKSDILSFKTAISASPYDSFSYSGYVRTPSSDSPAVAGLKSDIRSLKAVLLNRRNFPTA